MAARLLNALVAALVLAALVTQTVIAVQVPALPPEAAVGTLRGAPLALRLVRVFSFFTIESNLLTGVVAAWLVVRPRADGAVFRGLRLAAVTGIAVTGIVYSAVLADIHEPNGPAETLVNAAVHYAVPLLAVAGWLLFGPRPRVRRWTVPGALLYPVLWIAWTVVNGAWTGWYPYPFVDVRTLGVAAVARNGLVVVALIVVVALLFAAGDRWLPRPVGARGRERAR